jgi:LacI family transcriptional regulator
MPKQQQAGIRKSTVTLRTIARHVGLAPCSISAVLNDSPAAQRIPQRTKNRVLRAASKLNYQPNLSARALRTRRTHLVALLVADFAGYGIASLISGIERELRSMGYLLVLSSSGGASEAPELGASRMIRAGAEGIIAAGTHAPSESDVPSIAVPRLEISGQQGAESDAVELGAKAARAIVTQIEHASQGGPRMKTARARSHRAVAFMEAESAAIA